MTFETVRDAIITTLGGASNGLFTVIGFQKQARRPADTVSVYFFRGEFPKGAGSINGPVRHDCTFRIELTAARKAKGDIEAMLAEGATAQEIAAALVAFKDAADEANKAFDALFSAVYGILMDATNDNFGLTVGTVASRWVDEAQKDEPLPRGDLVTVTGSCLMTLSVSEDLVGEEGVEMTGYGISLVIGNDDDTDTATAGIAAGAPEEPAP